MILKHKTLAKQQITNNFLKFYNNNLKNIDDKHIFVDCTVGYGGHSIDIIKQFMLKNLLFDIDLNIKQKQILIKKYNNIKLIKDNFKNLHKYIDKNIYITGLIADFGLNNEQEKSDFFSYSKNNNQQIFDLRLDKTLKYPAYITFKNMDLYKFVSIFKEHTNIPFCILKELHNIFITKKIIYKHNILKIFNNKFKNKRNYFLRKFFYICFNIVNQQHKNVNELFKTLSTKLHTKFCLQFLCFSSFELDNIMFNLKKYKFKNIIITTIKIKTNKKLKLIKVENNI